MEWGDDAFNVSSELFRYSGNRNRASFLERFVCIPGFISLLYAVFCQHKLIETL